ncbi:MAG: hypothetical protein ACRC24_01240 [Vibrionaceae bacterium]
MLLNVSLKIKLFNKLFLLLALFWFPTQNIFAKESDYWNDWNLVGSASYKWGLRKLYDGALYTPSGKFEYLTPPLALALTYKRDVDADTFLQHIVKQFELLDFPQEQIEKWRGLMAGMWPDFKKGDRLIYVLELQGGAEVGLFFYQPRNGSSNAYGVLDDRLLAIAFADIWLAEQTPFLAQRKKLVDAL